MNDLNLGYRLPFDWPSLLNFLAARATPGVESVDGGVYRRTALVEGTPGVIEVGLGEREGELLVRSADFPEDASPQIERQVERLFDLAADSREIGTVLAGDQLLAPLLQTFPGIRLPGSWDPFETAVRAVVGQVVSVKVATTLTGRVVARYGERIETDWERLTHLYPSPQSLAEADLDGLGLSGQKLRSIRALAQGVAGGSLRFDRFSSLDDALERLQELPGIGPWTAHYIAMRALGETDAFPAGDLILRRAASADPSTALSERRLTSLSERWRPYRAYAAMLLWASYARRMQMSARRKGRPEG